jgi:acyl transferase domain-containing protein
VPNPEKTALLFPGLDALFMSSRLKRWLENEGALSALKEASAHLSRITGKEEDLAAFIAKHSRLHLADFDRTLVALTALQVGIARQIKEPWDIAQGCSHGDIARSVICDSLDYKDAVALLWSFAELRKTCPPGYTANVRNKDGSPLAQDQIDWLKQCNTPVSLWSDTNATIGGDTATLQKVAAEAASRGLKVKPVLQYPVHSPTMAPSMEALRAFTAHWPVRAPNKPVFSSVWVRYLTDGADVRDEGLASGVNEVRWVETLTHLYEKENVRTFINVGPSNTLTGWLFGSEKFQGLKLLDGWDLLKMGEE